MPWQDRPHLRYSRLLLPLSRDQASVDIVLGMSVYERAIPGIEPPISELKPASDPVSFRILLDPA